MRKLVFLIFVALSYLIFRPIIGNVWYPMHDTTSVARTYLLEKTLASGQVPAVWSAELNEGRGYPLFHFYAPAMTYLSLLSKMLFGSYFVGIKSILIIASLISMIGMYYLMRRCGRMAGLISAISYGLLPYAAINLYVRGAYSEYLSMSLLPWLFYAWQSPSTKKSQLFASLVTALFLLSHNLVPLITLPFIAIWAYLNNRSNLKNLLLPGIMTILLSSFYLFPLIFERGFVEADRVATTTSYTDHFIVPWQLWNSNWGFGGSGIGVEDGMSFKVGKIELVLALVGALSLMIKRNKKVWFFIFSTIFAAFMTTSYSDFIWMNIPYLQIVQFPWRFLSLVGFFISILAGFSLTLLKNKIIKPILFAAIIVAILILNLKLFNPQTVFPADISAFTSEEYLATIPSIIPEYRPIWLDMQNTNFTSKSVLPYNYYPTWKVTVDGKKVATYPSVNGLLAFDNPSGSSNIQAVQSHTELQFITAFISAITLLYLIKLYVQS